MITDDKYKRLFSKNLNYYMELKGKTQTDIINDLDIKYILISHKKQLIYNKNVILNFLLNLKKSFLKNENIKEV